MRLTIRHLTRYDYAPPAAGLAMRLRLFPSRFASQTVEDWAVHVNGEPVSPSLHDGCGVAEGLWTAAEPVSAAEVIAEGTVLRAEDAGILRGLKERTPPEVFLRETELTKPDDAIRALAESARQDAPLDTLHALAGAVRDAIDYRPETTDMATSAAAALSQGAGVCQDHAHVFVAAARCLDLPARYVAGYYLAGAEEGALTQTHGWAEGYAAGLGWVGFDVANRTCPTREHVRVAVSLDAGRGGLISGAVSGQVEETLSASVAITQAQQ
ncbi:transglutaminase family protein [Parvularcula oceani]|uniref:transglutaminase family protein n=1 Tax=Parvularcula oceani TaxID=1247963 RepID=UPI0005670DA2|nr:transglutaminase family protein [Parvularcula oceani]